MKKFFILNVPKDIKWKDKGKILMENIEMKMNQLVGFS